LTTNRGGYGSVSVILVVNSVKYWSGYVTIA